MNNMVFRYLGRVAGDGLLIIVHTARAPTEAEWEAYYQELLKHDPTKLKNLVFTDGGAPSGAQRKKVNDFLKGRASRCGVVTASQLVRGVVAALSWFNPDIKTFTSDHVDAALQYLDVREQEVAMVRREIQLLRKRIGQDDLKSITAF